MQSREVFERLRGLTRPWEVRDVDLALTENKVRVFVDLGEDAVLVCPQCGQPCPGYDRRQRQWRHLDTMQNETLVIAEVPRLKCPEHGVRQVSVPWAEDSSRFTALFEALVINWLKEASFAAVARQLGLSWDQVAGIQDRAVRRGLARRELTAERVCRAAHERAEGRAGLGAQGAGDDAVGVYPPRLGGADVEALVQLGDSLPARAGEEGRPDDQAPLGRGDQRGDEQRHQCPLRGHEQQDPVDQAQGVWVSQPRAVPQRDLFPPRRAGSLPRRRAVNPQEFLKRDRKNRGEDAVTDVAGTQGLAGDSPAVIRQRL